MKLSVELERQYKCLKSHIKLDLDVQDPRKENHTIDCYELDWFCSDCVCHKIFNVLNREMTCYEAFKLIDNSIQKERKIKEILK